MTKNKPLLSIIIISFNTSQLTLACLKSIAQDADLKNGHIPYEIIVVDNASTDDSAAVLKKQAITLIQNKTNLGFGAANNQGLGIAKGEYVLFLNSDTLIENSSISQCLTWLSSHPECLAVSPKLLNPDRSLQATGGFFPNLVNTIMWKTHLDDLPFVDNFVKPIHPHTPSFYTRDKFYLSDQRLDWITGAFILTRTSVVKKIKGFDESFFMYAEEVEMQYRMHLAFPKFFIQYLCGPQIVHIGGASAKNKSHKYGQENLGIQKFFAIHKPNQLFLVKPFLS